MLSIKTQQRLTFFIQNPKIDAVELFADLTISASLKNASTLLASQNSRRNPCVLTIQTYMSSMKLQRKRLRFPQSKDAMVSPVTKMNNVKVPIAVPKTSATPSRKVALYA